MRLATVGAQGIILVLTGGCAAPDLREGALPPPPDRGIAVSRSYDSCFAPDLDADEDGLDDRCELAQAEAFAPLLLTRAGGCGWDESVTPARPGGEYFFAVEPVGAAGRVRIAYLPAYYRDCGWTGLKCALPLVDCAPHPGDSEAIIVETAYDTVSGRWRTEAVFLSAHCFGRSGGSCRWYRGAELRSFAWVDGRARGAPVVWVAEGKNANYPSRAACERGHFLVETCARNVVAVRFPVRSARQNLGSLRRPAGDDGGCLGADHVGWGSRLVADDRRECFWSADARFLGWQDVADERGATPYFRYLTEVAGFGGAPERRSGGGIDATDPAR